MCILDIIYYKYKLYTHLTAKYLVVSSSRIAMPAAKGPRHRKLPNLLPSWPQEGPPQGNRHRNLKTILYKNVKISVLHICMRFLILGWIRSGDGIQNTSVKSRFRRFVEISKLCENVC